MYITGKLPRDFKERKQISPFNTHRLLQIFVPEELGKEPPKRATLAHPLFWAVVIVSVVVQLLSQVWLWAEGSRYPASLRKNFATPSPTNYLEGLNLGVFPRIIVISRINFQWPICMAEQTSNYRIIYSFSYHPLIYPPVFRNPRYLTIP